MTRYGPHDPATAPRTVTVRPPGKWARDEEVPIPPALVAQRERINTLAHQGVVPTGTQAIVQAAAAAQARAQRDAAMEGVEVGPNVTAEWKGHARQALWDLAISRPEFTTDDVWALLERRGIPAPDEPRALGPVVAKALRAGAIRDTGRMTRSNRRHFTKITVYERNHRE